MFHFINFSSNPIEEGSKLVKSKSGSYLNNRVLKLNVGFLLSTRIGTSHNSEFDIPEPIKVADDLIIDNLTGDLRMTVTKEGILVQAELDTQVPITCSRCLDDIAQPFHIHLEELYATNATVPTEFSIGADGILDLSPLIRAEILLDTSQRHLCREDCQGICPVCGINRNDETCDCVTEHIDPRLAVLKQLLEE